MATLERTYNTWHIALILFCIGLAVYWTGLASPFQGDDIQQIVNSIPVHSLSHFLLLFRGGTFYNGQGLAPLTGIYYRPLMMVTFALLYTLFGPHALFFHLFQLLLGVAGATLFYIVLCHFIRPKIAFLLAIIFLIHPLNSQVLFSIAAMQDALFFFFGIFGTLLLIRAKTPIGIFGAGFCFFLSILSKETGVLFSLLALLYLWWFKRKYVVVFLGFMVLPALIYLALKSSAVGFNAPSHIAPIDSLHFGARLMTAPSTMLFYISKFVFPWSLASSYYWVHTTFSMRYVLLPLLIDICVITTAIYIGVLIRKKGDSGQLHAYIFFTIWSFLGVIAHLNLIALDMTACDIWFYYSMAGLLGMIGIAITVLKPRMSKQWVLISICLICALGIRTSLRGLDWHDDIRLAKADIVASPDDYTAYYTLAVDDIQRNNLVEATTYDKRSIQIYPTGINYNALGVILTKQGDYMDAAPAFAKGIHYQGFYTLYDNLAAIRPVYGTPELNDQFFTTATTTFPKDTTIWFYDALTNYYEGNTAMAILAIDKAHAIKPRDRVITGVYTELHSGKKLTYAYNATSAVTIN